MSIDWPTAFQQAQVELQNLPRPFQGPFGLYEDVTIQLAPGQTVYVTGWYPIDPATLRVVADANPVNPARVMVIDADRGMFEITDPQPSTSMLVAYNYARLSDTEVDQCVVDGVEFLGFVPPGPPPPTAWTGLLPMDPGLYPAMWHYARYVGWTLIAAHYGEQVNVQLGQRKEDRQALKDWFEKSAQDQLKAAGVARDDFYKRQGRRFAPAAGRYVYFPADLNNPIRR